MSIASCRSSRAKPLASIRGHSSPSIIQHDQNGLELSTTRAADGGGCRKRTECADLSSSAAASNRQWLTHSGGYACATSARGGSGASRAQRTAGRRESSFASCHAGGLWPSSEGPSDLFRRGWLAVSTALWGFNSVLSGFNSAARVIWAGSRGLRLRCGDFRTAAGGCHHACPVMGRRGADAPSGPGLQLDSG